MRVEQLMARPVQCCRPEDTLERAAQLMWEHDCGCLPVISGDGLTRIASVITDRDICMCAFFQEKPLRELRVAEAMAKQVHVCRSNDSLDEAERIMRETRVRRLPVIDDDGSVVGVISLADLAQEAARELGAARPEITETDVGVTLAAICEPVGRQLAV